MDTKIIYCLDCGCGVIVKKVDGRTRRCSEHQAKQNKKNQDDWNNKYRSSYRRTPKEGRKKTYQRRYVDSVDDVEYCKNNWNSVSGCLSCTIKECIQPTDNDSFLPWENEGFYKDDTKIDYEMKRSIG